MLGEKGYVCVNMRSAVFFLKPVLGTSFPSRSQESQICIADVGVYFVLDLKFSGDHKPGLSGLEI